MKTLVATVLAIAGTSALRAQIPVTDVANLVNNQVAHVENIAKWADSIAQLRTQIDQLKQQIQIQSDLRHWTGDPVQAGLHLDLSVLGTNELVREFGQARASIVSTADSLSSLDRTGQGIYRTIRGTNIDLQPFGHDPLTFRRYAVLDGQQENFQQVVEDSRARERAVEEELASTLLSLKSASTAAEAQKLSAKIEALNGQLSALATQRRDQADQVVAQKIANDARLEQERMAAAELETQDDYLANKRVTSYFGNLRLRQKQP